MGTELLIGLALAFVVLGPERMHSMLGHLGRAKAQFDNASKEIRDQLAEQHQDGARISSRVPPTPLPAKPHDRS